MTHEKRIQSLMDAGEYDQAAKLADLEC